MSSETCIQHTQLVADIAVLKDNTNYIRNKLCKHVDEGERDGGFRDRLLLAEKEITDLKNDIQRISRGRWIIGFVSGIVSTLIATGSRDILVLLIKWIMGV